jgi:hypothetical protein
MAFKWQLLETMNADRRVTDALLKATIVLCGYLTLDERTLKPIAVYAAHNKMRARGGIKSKETVKAARRLGVELGYWIDRGETSKGVPVYELANPHSERIAMAVHDLEEAYKEQDAARKQIVRGSSRRVTKIGTHQKQQGTNNWPDRVPDFGPNYLRTDLRDYSLGKGANPLDVYDLTDGGSPEEPLRADEPLPVPKSDTEAAEIIERLCAGRSLGMGFTAYFKARLAKGLLRPADIEKHFQEVGETV